MHFAFTTSEQQHSQQRIQHTSHATLLQGPAPTPSTGPDSRAEERLPREVIQQLRDVVFGFDTFYVTGVENYEANGVLFKGNLRGRSPADAFARTSKRFQVTHTDSMHGLLVRPLCHPWVAQTVLHKAPPMASQRKHCPIYTLPPCASAAAETVLDPKPEGLQLLSMPQLTAIL